MPLLGLGTWRSEKGKVAEAVRVALDVGYRHIDCAAVYGNETEVGEALKDKLGSVCLREEVWITSKVWNNCHARDDVIAACRKTLEDLGLDYVDLYLIHWPIGLQRGDDLFPKDEAGNMIYANTPLTETWAAMEELVTMGLVKAIGLSNFNKRQIENIMASATIQPAVLQVECHPYQNQSKLLAFCQENGIVVTAYSPLGSPDRPWASVDDPPLLQSPQVLEIAAKYNKTSAQVLIRFQIQRGVVVIPKSVTPSRIEANSQVFDFTLSEEDMTVLLAFHNGWRACIPMIEVNGEKVPRDGAHPEFPFHDEY